MVHSCGFILQWICSHIFWNFVPTTNCLSNLRDDTIMTKYYPLNNTKLRGKICTLKHTIWSHSKIRINQPLYAILKLCHHHHHVVLVARISLTLSRHFSLSFIASGRSSGQHPVSSHSCWMYVRAGRPAFARPCVEVHKSTSLMSSSLLVQQYPACLVRLTWIVFVMGGRWPYSWCLVGCCRQDLFKIARSIQQLQTGYYHNIFIIVPSFTECSSPVYLIVKDPCILSLFI